MMKKIFCTGFFCLISCWTLVMAQQTHRFEINNGSFEYDGQPVQIHSGEMHFARIPRAYWRQRLRMLKAMGLNSVATYVFWNYHNTAPGVWDFSTGNHDIAAFIRMAGEEGLFVILRPGPYACAEWEFGGYPWWLQKDTSLVIRTYNQPFLDSCKNYIHQLAAQVKDLQVTHGGPLIMVQVENEFGSYVAQRKDIPLETHRRYNQAIKQLLQAEGFDVPLFTSDGSWLFEGGALPGVLPTANGEHNVDNLRKTVNQYNNNQGPYMVAEYYPGWLDHWGEPFVKVPTDKVVEQLETYLKNGVSFNIYMAHGGTNFGFTAGANYNGAHDIQPDITSYDYDAPVSEAGWATPKYRAIRSLIQRYTTDSLPPIPEAAPVLELPALPLTRSADLLTIKKAMTPVIADTPVCFESLGQGYGYVLYSRQMTKAVKGSLTINGLRDYAVIYVNGQKAGVLNRQSKEYTLAIDIPAHAVVDILVENMGRINYGAQIVDNEKGILSGVLLNGQVVEGNWNMYPFPMDTIPAMGQGQRAREGRAALYSGEFNLTRTGDVFLDMSQWQKGIVWVNGHNLGRYWNIGPQQTLYLPGCWLQKGNNHIVVFEQLNDHITPVIKSAPSPELGKLKE